MNRGFLVLGGAVLAGLLAFGAMRWEKERGLHHGGSLFLDAMPELEWLKKDLRLTDEQFAKVRALHVAYRPKCGEMCGRIAKAHSVLESVAARNRQLTPEFEAALFRRFQC